MSRKARAIADREREARSAEERYLKLKNRQEKLAESGYLAEKLWAFCLVQSEELKDFGGAQATLDKIIKYSKETEKLKLQIDALKQKGSLYGRTGDFDRAMDEYARAMKIVNSAGPDLDKDKREYDITLFKTYTEIQAKRYVQARKDYARVRDLLKRLDFSIFREAPAYLKLGKLPKRAADAGFLVETIETEADDGDGRIEALELLNDISEYLIDGEYPSASSALEKAKTIVGQCKNAGLSGASLGRFKSAEARVEKLQGRYEKQTAKQSTPVAQPGFK